jgi:hypothetical protein
VNWSAAAMLGALVVLWLAHSWAFPLKVCGSCKGNPRTSDSGGKNFRVNCWRCHDSGRMRRVGSRILRGGWGKL